MVLKLTRPLIATLILVGFTVASESHEVRSVEVEIEHLEPGQLVSVRWERLYVWILRRSEEDIENLRAISPSRLAAPRGEYWEESLVRAYDTRPILPKLLALDQVPLEKAPFRSLRPDIVVVLGLSPETGCVLNYYPADSSVRPIEDWVGGFHDPCSGSAYDLAGRVYKSKDNGSRWNLYIPPHQFIDDKSILIGLGNPPRALTSNSFEPSIDYDSLGKEYRLHEAAKRGRLEIVKSLVSGGLAVDTPVHNGVTPLLVAVIKGQYAVAAFLLEKGANPNRANFSGFAPVHGAVAGYEVGMVDLLAENDANLNQICPTVDCKGTALNFAMTWMKGEPELSEMVARLIKFGADPSRKHKGRSAYDWAKETSQEHLIPLMTEAVAARRISNDAPQPTQ